MKRGNILLAHAVIALIAANEGSSVYSLMNNFAVVSSIRCPWLRTAYCHTTTIPTVHACSLFPARNQIDVDNHSTTSRNNRRFKTARTATSTKQEVTEVSNKQSFFSFFETKVDSTTTETNRPTLMRKTLIQGLSLALAGTIIAIVTRPAWAISKSRTDGYAVLKTEAEWKQQLSPMQYYVLRQGGTEKPGFSILEKETRSGTYVCAGCGAPLFESNSKFKSGTGWPSFARSVENNVEIELSNQIAASFSGLELRCHACGGHVGHVFTDGMLFVGTEAAKTGKRFCIDGAALLFYPAVDENQQDSYVGGDGERYVVRGDLSAKSSFVKQELPQLFDPPTITPRDRV